MNYQQLLNALAEKLVERIAERARQLEIAAHVHATFGPNGMQDLAQRDRVLKLNKQISKLSNALHDIAECAGGDE